MVPSRTLSTSPPHALVAWLSRRLRLSRETRPPHAHDPRGSEGLRRLLQEDHVRALLAGPRYTGTKRLNRFEHQVFSQNGEDGILREVFRRIGTTDRTFLEFGVGDGQRNNTTFLLAQGWRGWWIEGNQRSAAAIRRAFARPLAGSQLALLHWMVTAENIAEAFRRLQVPAEIDLLSLDIDRNTWHVLAAALPIVRPRALVVEYNATYPADVDWKVEYAADRWWDRTSYFGASLKAFERLGEQHGYALVGCELSGVNAFFVRRELCGDRFEAPFTAENHYEPARYYLARTHGHPPNFSDLTG